MPVDTADSTEAPTKHPCIRKGAGMINFRTAGPVAKGLRLPRSHAWETSQQLRAFPVIPEAHRRFPAWLAVRSRRVEVATSL